MHSLQVFDADREKNRLLNCLNRKLPDKIYLFGVDSVKKLMDADASFVGWGHEIDIAKLIAFMNFNINDVFTQRKGKAWEARSLEIYVVDEVSFIVDILIHGNEGLYQKWANPSKEIVWFLFVEKLDVGVGVFV